MHCVSTYPMEPEMANLETINALKEKAKKIEIIFARPSSIMETLTGVVIAILIFYSGKLIFKDEIGINNFDLDFVDLFNELETEIAWSKGEDSSESIVLTDIIEEIQNQDAGSNVAGGNLDDIKLFIETNEAILNYNDQVNWGTTLYKKLLSQMNQKRVALGFTALKINEQLTNASEMHSGDMHFQEFFSHKSFDGSSYADRAKSAGFVGKVYGEFLYRASVDPISAFNAWWITCLLYTSPSPRDS